MPQQAIAKGKLEPWQVSISQVEDAAGIQLSLPANTNPQAEPPLWPADLKAWNAKHKELCPKPAKKKKTQKKRKQK